METLSLLGIICAVVAAGLFIATISVFFVFRIPILVKESKGTLEQKQIDEIRALREYDARQRGKINVFEELEKQAKPQTSYRKNISNVVSQDRSEKSSNGTVVLKNNSKEISPGFIVYKDITFVCTNEVL